MARTGTSRRYQWSGYLLGFVLGGFFDGILLHQILQWHHFLSTINSDNIRLQVAADGYFHVLMYVSPPSASGCCGHRETIPFVPQGACCWEAS